MQPKRALGIHSMDPVTALEARMDVLLKKMDSLAMQSAQPVMNIQPAQSCDFCGGNHPNHECQAGNSSVATSTFEDANFVSNQFNRSNPQEFNRNNPYSNTYNPGWRNHPNFSWSQNQKVQQPSGFQQPPGFQTRQEQRAPMQAKPSLEDVMTKFISTVEQKFSNQEASIRNLEAQIGQLANLMADRAQGSLPSNTEKNPREHAKSIMLRSGGEAYNDILAYNQFQPQEFMAQTLFQHPFQPPKEKTFADLKCQNSVNIQEREFSESEQQLMSESDLGNLQHT